MPEFTERNLVLEFQLSLLAFFSRPEMRICVSVIGVVCRCSVLRIAIGMWRDADPYTVQLYWLLLRTAV